MDWQMMGQFAQRFHAFTSTFVDQVGVPRGQAAALMQIAHEEGMTQTQIAHALCIQGATVTTMLQRMEDGNLIRRERDTNDNRLVRVYLTAHGHAKVDVIAGCLKVVEERMSRGIPQTELDHMRSLVARMIANMDAVQSE
jgi:DNA-binding MarR family transcriptional regulator